MDFHWPCNHKETAKSSQLDKKKDDMIRTSIISSRISFTIHLYRSTEFALGLNKIKSFDLWDRVHTCQNNGPTTNDKIVNLVRKFILHTYY